MKKLPYFDPTSKYYVYPKDIPKGMITTLVVLCLLMGLSALRTESWLGVMWQWAIMLILIPSATTIVALPIKMRDKEFELKLAYYMGMFVAFLYTLGKLRYLR